MKNFSRGSTNKHWSENHQFGSRAIFRTSIEPAQLVLTNVEKSDSGAYACRVDYRSGYTLLCSTFNVFFPFVRNCPSLFQSHPQHI